MSTTMTAPVDDVRRTIVDGKRAGGAVGPNAWAWIIILTLLLAYTGVGFGFRSHRS